MLRTIKSFKYAISGLKTVWREETNFKLELISAFLVIGIALYFKFSLSEFIFCVLAIAIVLSGEIVNTAVEDICNKIESSPDPVIGKIKDIMAGYVLVSAISALAIGVLVFYSHFK